LFYHSQFFFGSVPTRSGAQEIPLKDGKSLWELDTQDLVDIPVSSAVVSKAQPLREATGITTVISGDEIRALGARDLKEVLELVPGVSFGTDVANIVGIAFRGMWAQDGRVLLQIDGQPMNELAFGSLQFGHHYPVQAIERIEIMNLSRICCC
jgi:outer membrane receptor for ferrienterochelin and colicin